MKVMIACGGTGGHLFPGLAVAETLLARRHQVHLLVTSKAVDQTALQTLLPGGSTAQTAVVTIPAIGYGGLCRLWPFACRLAASVRLCLKECESFVPDVVLGMGGFASAPAILAARWRHTPSVIHESNAVPGKANRMVSRWVNQVAVGWAECARFFRRQRVAVTGTPLRAGLRCGRVADARQRLGLLPDRMTVLVMGGSQGARALNEAVVAALPQWVAWRDAMQFLHLAGREDAAWVRSAYATAGMTATVMEFCAQMELAYSAADLAVSRAGAATLTELAAFGVPAILVPYPHAAGNHQWHNARAFARAGAAQLLPQSELGRLAAALEALVRNESQRQAMGRAARKLAVDNAAERVVELLEQYAR